MLEPPDTHVAAYIEPSCPITVTRTLDAVAESTWQGHDAVHLFAIADSALPADDDEDAEASEKSALVRTRSLPVASSASGESQLAQQLTRALRSAADQLDGLIRGHRLSNTPQATLDDTTRRAPSARTAPAASFPNVHCHLLFGPLASPVNTSNSKLAPDPIQFHHQRLLSRVLAFLNEWRIDTVFIASPTPDPVHGSIGPSLASPSQSSSQLPVGQSPRSAPPGGRSFRRVQRCCFAEFLLRHLPPLVPCCRVLVVSRLGPVREAPRFIAMTRHIPPVPVIPRTISTCSSRTSNLEDRSPVSPASPHSGRLLMPLTPPLKPTQVSSDYAPLTLNRTTSLDSAEFAARHGFEHPACQFQLPFESESPNGRRSTTSRNSNADTDDRVLTNPSPAYSSHVRHGSLPHSPRHHSSYSHRHRSLDMSATIVASAPTPSRRLQLSPGDICESLSPDPPPSVASPPTHLQHVASSQMPCSSSTSSAGRQPYSTYSMLRGIRFDIDHVSSLSPLSSSDDD